MDLACGYGRDSNYFAANGLKVEGIDISEEAIAMAQKNYKGINFITGSILQTPYKKDFFNVVYGNFIIHLFPLNDRLDIIKESHRITKPGGVAVFSVASVEDADYGQGLETEKNCFVNSRGVVKYYYSLDSVFQEFKIFNRIEIENIEEYHTHDTPHTHKSYLIFVYKDDDGEY